MCHSQWRSKCWGKNNQAQLGLGYLGGNSHVPQAINSLSGGIVHITTGLFSSCSLDGIARFKCWAAGYGSTPCRFNVPDPRRSGRSTVGF